MEIDVTDIEEDGTDIPTSQEIEPVDLVIDWDSKEEDDILKKKANVIKRKKSWLKLKRGTDVDDKVDYVSNVGLPITGSRRLSRISTKKIHNPPLVQKNRSNRKTKMSTPTSPHQVI